jgi:hypothetical protein
MSLRSFLIVCLVCAVLCSSAWWLVLNYINPQEGGIFALLMFYGSLGVASASLLTIIGYGWRRWRCPEEVHFHLMIPAIRQAGLLTAVILGSLILQSQRLLNWWNAGLLIIVLAALEFVFISFGRHQA